MKDSLLIMTSSERLKMAITVGRKLFLPRGYCLRCGKLIGNYLCESGDLNGEEIAIEVSQNLKASYSGMFCTQCRAEVVQIQQRNEAVKVAA